MQKRSSAIRKLVPASVAAGIRKNVLRRKPQFFHLEVHLTDHCNLKCKGCGRYMLMPRSDLERRMKGAPRREE